MEVPIDHSNRSLGTTSIAFIKLAGKNATVDSPSIVLIPGKIPTGPLSKWHESFVAGLTFD